MNYDELLKMIEGNRLQRRHEWQIDRYYAERERKEKIYAGAGRLCYCDICLKEHVAVYGDVDLEDIKIC